MPVALEVVTAAYGRPALDALRAAIAAAKGGDPLAPVTVVVPTNHVGVTARRRLASGGLGVVTDRGVGVAAVSFLTAYRLAELLGAPALAARGRRPSSPPVLAAALRRALSESPGMFAPVADHPATETALAATYAELSDVSDGARRALATAGRRADEVVRLCRRAREILAPAWYDESDLCEAAQAAIAEAPGAAGGGATTMVAELGHVVIHAPQDLRPAPAALLATVAAHRPTTIVAALTNRPDADAGIAATLARLGAALPHAPSAPAPDPAHPTPAAPPAPPGTPPTDRPPTAQAPLPFPPPPPPRAGDRRWARPRSTRAGPGS